MKKKISRRFLPKIISENIAEEIEKHMETKNLKDLTMVVVIEININTEPQNQSSCPKPGSAPGKKKYGVSPSIYTLERINPISAKGDIKTDFRRLVFSIKKKDRVRSFLH